MNIQDYETYTSVTITDDFEDREFVEIVFSEITFEKSFFTNCTFTNCAFNNCTFKNATWTQVLLDKSTFFNCSFSKSRVMGVDWSGDLSALEVTFDSCDISYSNFSFLTLKNFALTNSKAHEVVFNETVLKKADCTGTDFRAATFHNSDLRDVDFTDATNYQVDLQTNKIEGATFSMQGAINLLEGLGVTIAG